MKREIFANALNEIIKDSGIRQNVIAEALDLSSAAISQFVHGTALPKADLLAEIMSILNVHSSKRILMQQWLLEAKEEAQNSDSPIIEFDEKEDEEEDDGQVNSFNLEVMYKNSNCSKIFFSEPAAGVPIIQLESLRMYDPNLNLADFAANCSHDIILRDYGSADSPVIVQTTGDMLGLRYFGMVQMLVVNSMPVGSSVFELFYYRKKDFFRMLPRSDKKELLHGLESLFDEDSFPTAKPTWMLSVIEFTVFPFTSEDLLMNQGVGL